MEIWRVCPLIPVATVPWCRHKASKRSGERPASVLLREDLRGSGQPHRPPTGPLPAPGDPPSRPRAHPVGTTLRPPPPGACAHACLCGRCSGPGHVCFAHACVWRAPCCTPSPSPPQLLFGSLQERPGQSYYRDRRQHEKLNFHLSMSLVRPLQTSEAWRTGHGRAPHRGAQRAALDGSGHLAESLLKDCP